MSRCPKCRFCGKLIEHDPFIHTSITSSGKEKKDFYCNEVEYIKSLKVKKERKVNVDLNRVYSLSSEIIGRTKISNTVFWKEKKDWNEIASDKYIADFLEENRIDLSESLSRITDSEFCRIRYLSAIIRNKIGDYLNKIKTEESPKKDIKIEFFEETNSLKKRRSLDELEEDI